ncbi:unnamed protein product [Calypogeia fissa]
MILCGIVSPAGSPSASSAWESDWETDEEGRDEEARVEEEKRKRRRKTKRRKEGPPVFGDHCHSCRREIAHPVLFVRCSRCPLRFCGSCLLRKHGEDVEEEMQECVRWVCPICRGGCGPGCRMNCCGCGPCRKYQQLEPAGRVLPAAVKAGFSNVHDYLVHFETGEAPDVIAKRKEGRGWTKATGAMDSSPDFNFTWALKRIRSRRKRLVTARSDSKWCTEDPSFKRPSRNGVGEEPTILHAIIPETTQLESKRARRPSVRLTA